MTDLTKRYKKKVLTIDATEQLELPVVMYPSFKLRSSMYDKDPLIWGHLLETYIDFAMLLLSFPGDSLKQFLVPETQNEVRRFVQRYLVESAKEKDDILTLGSVNPLIAANTSKMRVLMFQCCDKYGLQQLGVANESLWAFAEVYASGNAGAVGRLVLKASLCSNMARHVTNTLVVSGTFTVSHLETLFVLWGHQEFAAAFVDVRWVRDLEKYFDRGHGVHAKVCKQLLATSLISCPADAIVKIYRQLFTNRREFCNRYPLCYFLAKNEFYGRVSDFEPGMLEFVVGGAKGLQELTEMFPGLSARGANYLLKKYSNLQAATSELLENPRLVEEAEHAAAEASSDSFTSADDEEAVRKSTLTRALEMLYESDEDEPDDTYESSTTDAQTMSEDDKVELYLFSEWKKNPQLFARDSKTRRTPARARLLEQVGWSHERLEGWLHMLLRNPARLKIMEDRWMFSRDLVAVPKARKQKSHQHQGQGQTQIQNSNQTQSQSQSQNTNASAQQQKPPLSGAEKAKRAHKRKEKNKAKTANHNRKAQASKKMQN